jgi:hypothetical protein
LVIAGGDIAADIQHPSNIHPIFMPLGAPPSAPLCHQSSQVVRAQPRGFHLIIYREAANKSRPKLSKELLISPLRKSDR